MTVKKLIEEIRRFCSTTCKRIFDKSKKMFIAESKRNLVKIKEE